MNSHSTRSLGALLALLLAVTAACGGDGDSAGGPAAGTSASGGAAKVPDAVFVASAPAGAVGVRQAVASAEPGAELVVRAVVGGRKQAFVEGRAILVAADAELVPCPPDEGCPTPWDFCCEPPETLRANTMTIQVVDAEGRPIAASLEGAGGLDELKTIVVAGAVRSTEGSLVLDARQIHVVDR